jgi:hypothetical protein
MTWLAASAAALIGFLGLMHLGYALHDCLRSPRYFRPLEESLLPLMRGTKTALAPEGANYWRGVLGFHLSHSIGVLMFALMIWVTSSYSIAWMQPVLVVIGTSYVVISHSCWFRIPTIGIGIATILMAFGFWS